MIPKVVKVSGDRCQHCGTSDLLLLGDGPVVCQTCVYHYGRMAASPYEFAAAELTTIEAAHKDRVTLVWSSSALQLLGGKPKAWWMWVEEAA